jgi:hypothetical protein
MIFKIIIAVSLAFSFIHSAPIVQNNGTQKKLKIKTIYEVKLPELTSKDSDVVLESSISKLDFKTIIPVCGQVYESQIDSSGKFVDGERFRTLVDSGSYKTIIEDFNPNTGDFKCRYINESIFPKKGLITVNSLELWNSRIKMIEIDEAFGLSIIKTAFGSDYWISDVDKFLSADKKNIDGTRNENNPYSGSDFDVYESASRHGVWIDENTNIEEKDKSFTLSQFLINLITLNSEVVTGVDGYGDIKINKDVERRLTILHEQDGDGAGWDDLVRIKDMIFSNAEENKKNVARKKYTDANSFLDYFNFKLFGMYYRFMGIAWSNIFAYASMLFLSFMVLYSTAVVGVKYGVHKLDESTNGRPFEFPAKIRLISIGAVLVLSFVQFPAGDGVPIKNKDGQTEMIQSQTSIAKIAISYLGNIGTVVADISAGNSVTVYLDYLLKATNSQSFNQVKNNIIEYEKEVALQAVRVAFFAKECMSPYEDKMFNTDKSFQGVNSDNIEQWEWEGGADAKKLFTRGTEDASVSPYLCKKIEKDVAITRKMLKLQQSIITKNMENREQQSGESGQAELSTLFVMTQLQATQSLGWINIASLPILHVFMMNAGALGDGMGLGKRGNGEIKSIVLDSTMQNMQKSDKQLEEEALDYLKSGELDGIFDTGIMRGFLVNILSKQVYSMLPAFEDTRKSIQVVVSGGAETIVEILTTFTPAKGFSIVKKLMRFGFDEDKSTKATPVMALLLYMISFYIAVVIYKIMLSAIFGGMVSLLIILKIVLYFVDVFAYFFVSPLVIGWKLTINDRTDRLHRYITNGFVLLTLRPTLIVFSSVMFIVAYEVMLSVYSLSFDMIFSSLEMADDLYEESGFGSMIMMGAIKGFGEVMILVFGMILAYQIILNGDDMILQKFGYKDDGDNGMANQLGSKIQGIAGGKI